ncbi:tight adherence protein B [Conyzicola lurida]|uniref:Tight adherence protein B n=1 Tax=Conyzicola lurida TaxID=1172621 RepID=A0A841AQ65_9MICO|nr:tight adherence protein B [Conyzicola lurida]
MASVVQRLAVLMTAGVPPSSAWTYLAPESSPIVAAVAERAVEGSPVAEALVGHLEIVGPAERQAWRGLAAAWRVATETGAGLAPTLREFAVSLRSLANAQREIAVALAAPVATARLVMVLPLVGLLFGLVLGFDTLGILFTTGPGLACLGLGVALMLTAAAWNRRLVASAQPRDLTPGLRYELMAIAVSGGGSIDRASTAVAVALRSTGLDDVGDELGVDAVLALSRRAGVPAGELLRSEGEEARRSARADAAAKASVLAVRLMLPLGLCVLPAFLLLGVAPLLIAVITSTVSGF